MNKEIVNDGIIEEKQQELPTEKRWSWIIANVTNETAMPAIRKTIGVIAPEELDITLPLIFEEIYTNISHYSYPLESKLKKAVITLIDRKKEFIMDFKDEGIPFDTTAYPEPDPSDNAHKIGGHGIELVRKLSSKMEYTREKKEDGTSEINHLVIYIQKS
jgi:anti-sigma regulatory factor (Ser/Thr protein kinase)